MLTISKLSARTGTPRTSIHFYLREGLLPAPYKSAVNRAYYTEDHVRLLGRIRELKQEGLTLAQIRSALRDDLAEVEDDTELLARERERVRQTILRVATQEFMEHGYDHARITDIVREAGVTSQVLYDHFPSKAELLVESFRTFISWNLAFVEPKLESADAGERLLWRLQADAKANEFGSSVMALIRSESSDDPGLIRLVEQTWAPIVRYIVQEFESVLKPGATPAVSLELLAYSMLGAMHNASLRASWDETFTREDLLAAHLWLYLAALAGLSSQVDIDSQMARYRELIQQIAARAPESPPPSE